MVQDVVIEPIGNGPYVSITADGAKLGHMSSEAHIKFEAGAFPVLTLKVPFVRCHFSGKCMVRLEETGKDFTVFQGLAEENEQLKQIIEDQNRKIAILLDT